MSEYFFGLGRGKVADSIRDRVDDICRAHNVAFVNPTMPGEGPRYWFAGPNRGEPFDKALRKAVMADLEAAGLVNPDGSLRSGRDEEREDD